MCILDRIEAKRTRRGRAVTRLGRVGVVAVGYGAALLAGATVVGIRVATTNSLALGRQEASSTLDMWVGLSVLRILVAPLLALTSLVCTVLSPGRVSRLAFLAVAVMEAAVTGYGGLVWFVPALLHRP